MDENPSLAVAGRPAVTWTALRSARPDLADSGRELLYAFGVGLAFLATVRRDGGPRVHPMCPLIHKGPYAFLIPSPKRDDLARDGRYSMHSFPLEDNEDAFYLTGIARPVADDDLRAALVARFIADRHTPSMTPAELDGQQLFELRIATCMLTRTSGHGDPSPTHTVWHAPG